IGQDQSISLNDRARSRAAALATVRMAHHHDDGGRGLLVDVARRQLLGGNIATPEETARAEYCPEPSHAHTHAHLRHGVGASPSRYCDYFLTHPALGAPRRALSQVSPARSST